MCYEIAHFKDTEPINQTAMTSSMKRLAILALTAITLDVGAQTTFGFSGLQWGMSISSVMAQLKASSINASALESVACRLSSECWVRFNDGDSTPPRTVEGSVRFKSGRLVGVYVFRDGYRAPQREAKLRQMYGAPTSVDNSQCARGPEYCNQLFWKSPANESLEFSNSGAVSYQSGALNNEIAADKVKDENRVRF